MLNDEKKIKTTNLWLAGIEARRQTDTSNADQFRALPFASFSSLRSLESPG